MTSPYFMRLEGPGHGPVAGWKLARSRGAVKKFCEVGVAKNVGLNRLKSASPGRARIVSLAPSATSILFEVGARRSLVGVTKWCCDVADVRELPQVGDCWHMGDVEEIMKLRPTLVIGSVPYKQETVAKILAEPVNFLAMNPRSLADVESDVRLLARIVGRTSSGEQVIRKMRAGFSVVQRKAKATIRSRGRKNAARAVRVYCEAWPNPRISSPPWVAELVTIAGGKMVVPAGERVTDTQLAESAPEVIVLAWAATGTQAKVSEAYKIAAWKDVPAIRNRRVVVIADELLNTPGPPLVEGAKALLRAIHGV
jgi:iron complex transport system substrate-binding protein